MVAPVGGGGFGTGGGGGDGSGGGGGPSGGDGADGPCPASAAPEGRCEPTTFDGETRMTKLLLVSLRLASLARTRSRRRPTRAVRRRNAYRVPYNRLGTPVSRQAPALRRCSRTLTPAPSPRTRPSTLIVLPTPGVVLVGFAVTATAASERATAASERVARPSGTPRTT